MEKIFGYADEFLNQSDWKDLALIKFCLAAIGIMCGIALPKKARRTATVIASIIFICTYIPLMSKLFRIMGIVKPREIEQ